jgi:hypothetical protein
MSGCFITRTVHFLAAHEGLVEARFLTNLVNSSHHVPKKD